MFVIKNYFLNQCKGIDKINFHQLFRCLFYAIMKIYDYFYSQDSFLFFISNKQSLFYRYFLSYNGNMFFFSCNFYDIYITKVFLRDTNFTYILFLHINLIYFYTIISSQFSRHYFLLLLVFVQFSLSILQFYIANYVSGIRLYKFAKNKTEFVET